MGWSFRKSIKIAPGIKLNLSKSGVGVSGGVKGLRLGVGPRGAQVTAGKGGVQYRKQIGMGAITGGAKSLGLIGFLVILVIVLLAAVGALAWYVMHNPH